MRVTAIALPQYGQSCATGRSISAMATILGGRIAMEMNKFNSKIRNHQYY
jgi:hypothetical protein